MGRTLTTRHDTADRPMQTQERDGDNHLYTSRISYDGCNRLSGIKETVGMALTACSTAFAYGNDDKLTSIQYGSAAEQSVYEYDDLPVADEADA